MFGRLVEGIVDGTFAPGEPLREARLASDWGVSRTPVREAVRRLAAMGLVELRRNQRPLVRRLNPGDVADLYEVRGALELLAFDLAWERIPPGRIATLAATASDLGDSPHTRSWTRRALALDNRLHRLWTERSGNHWLERSIAQYQPFVRILQKLVARDETSAATSLREHTAILKAIENRDRQRARGKLQAHLRNASRLAARLAASPQPSLD